MGLLATILKCLGLALLALCGVGFVYQQIGDALDRRHAPPASEMIRVDGHAIHFVCEGSGNRVYLLDAGMFGGAYAWGYVAPLLALSGRVCAFDRPGLGWSDDTGAAHDVLALAGGIGAIVRAAHVRTPFVYVGHSLGADDAIAYYGLHPRDVAALVLLEPRNPGAILEKFHGTRAQAMAAPDCDLRCNGAEAAAFIGATRFAAWLTGMGRDIAEPRLRFEFQAELARPSHARAFAATLETAAKSAFEMMDVTNFGTTPVLVLTSSQPRRRTAGESPSEYREWRSDQLAWYAALARMSAHGAGPVIIEGTDHAGMVTTKKGAAEVSAAITDFLDRNISR